MNKPAGAFYHSRAVRLPDGRDGLFEAEWDPATGRWYYRVRMGQPPLVAVLNVERLERGDLSAAEFQAVCRR